MRRTLGKRELEVIGATRNSGELWKSSTNLVEIEPTSDDSSSIEEGTGGTSGSNQEPNPVAANKSADNIPEELMIAESLNSATSTLAGPSIITAIDITEYEYRLLNAMKGKKGAD